MQTNNSFQWGILDVKNQYRRRDIIGVVQGFQGFVADQSQTVDVKGSEIKRILVQEFFYDV